MFYIVEFHCYQIFIFFWFFFVAGEGTWQFSLIQYIKGHTSFQRCGSQDSLILGDRREILVLGLALTAQNSTGVMAYALVDVSISNALSSNSTSWNDPNTSNDHFFGIERFSRKRSVNASRPLYNSCTQLLFVCSVFCLANHSFYSGLQGIAHELSVFSRSYRVVSCYIMVFVYLMSIHQVHFFA